ncbi:MAG: enoyl-CoA hydratase-related protein [Thermoleophilia bacterium]
MAADDPRSERSDVRVVRDGARMTVTIDRPDRLNALRTTTLRELCDAFAEANDDPGVGVVVLTGAGERAFTAGGDVRDPTSGERQKREQLRLFMILGELIRTCGVPVICRVRGWCIGAGNELNVLCDLTIAGESAVFGQAGTRLGWAPAWWSAQTIGRAVGDKRAREIVYTSRRYSAREALEMGLVNAVVADDELDAEVDRWCAAILANSPEGLRLAKAGLNAGSDAARSSIIASGELHAINWFHGPDPAEGVRAFQEGRPPDWRVARRGEGPEPAAE